MACSCNNGYYEPDYASGLGYLAEDAWATIAKAVVQGTLDICPDKDPTKVPYATAVAIAFTQYTANNYDFDNTLKAVKEQICQIAPVKSYSTGGSYDSKLTPATTTTTETSTSPTTAYIIGGALILATLYFVFGSKKKGKKIEP